MQRAPEFEGKTLHIWDDDVTYLTLTTEAIRLSVEKANALNAAKQKRCELVELKRIPEIKQEPYILENL